MQAKEAKQKKELTEVDVNASNVQISLFRMLAKQQNDLIGGGGGSTGADEVPIDITVDASERLIMDHKDERRLLVYLINGKNDQLELRASRDYTVETGIASYNYSLSKRASAGRILKQIEQLVRRSGDDIDSLTLSNIQYLLAISPESYKILEDNRRIVKRFQSTNSGNQPLKKRWLPPRQKHKKPSSLSNRCKVISSARTQL